MFLVINQKRHFSEFKLQDTRYQYFIKMSSPLTTWQLVKMSGPIILFEILLPLLDNFTDLRMIIRLYWGIPGCKAGNAECLKDPATFCEDRQEDYYRELNSTQEDYYCERNKHPHFASMLLGIIVSFTRINMRLFSIQCHIC